MTFPVRIRIRHIAMTVTTLLMMHVVGMAVNPLGMHADVPDGSSHAHAMTTDHDPGRGASAGTGNGVAAPDLDHSHDHDHDQDITALSAWICIDTLGIASQPRAPLEPVVFVAVLPIPVGADIGPCVGASLEWSPPVRDASALRVFLQVFRN